MTLSVLLGVAGQEAVTPRVDVTLVVEPARDGALVLTCNGKVLDPKRVLTGVHAALRPVDPGDSRMFVLFDQAVTLDKTFEIASLIEGPMGVKGVRYFVFSRKTSVMQEIKPLWERWTLSFDGKLEKAPWVAR